MTSNSPDTTYLDKMKNYQQVLTMFVGPTELFISGDTLQLKDYSKTDWPWYFDGEAKLKRHETVFPQECRIERLPGTSDQLVPGSRFLCLNSRAILHVETNVVL